MASEACKDVSGRKGCVAKAGEAAGRAREKLDAWFEVDDEVEVTQGEQRGEFGVVQLVDQYGWVTARLDAKPYPIKVKYTDLKWVPPKPPLPPGWSELIDSESGSKYYQHENGDSAWERPFLYLSLIHI